MSELSDIFRSGGTMGALMRAHLWEATPLGLPHTWAQNLKTAIGICLASREPVEIWWGEEPRRFFNDAYLTLMGDVDPKAGLGELARTIPYWSAIEPLLVQVREGGVAPWLEEIALEVWRAGRKEEAYASLSFAPLHDAHGLVEGIFCTWRETSERIFSARRLSLLRALAIEATSRVEAGDAMASAFLQHSSDVPFALFYDVDDTGQQAELIAAAGLPEQCSACQDLVSLYANERAAWPLASASGLAFEQVTDLGVRFKDIPALRSHAGGQEALAPQQALIIPLQGGDQERPHGFLVVGLSPWLAFDEAYRSFLLIVGERVGHVLARARLYERGSGSSEAGGNSHIKRWQRTQGASILVAEGSADMQKYLSRLLQQAGWQAQVVGDGNEALAQAFLQPPDLVIADAVLPSLDGFSLLRALRSDSRTCTIPVILLSGRQGEEARVESMEEGADDCLAKPFSARELVARIGSQLEMLRVRKEAADHERQLLSSIQSSELELQLIAKATNDAIWDRDLTVGSMRWNEGLSALFGYTPESIRSTPEWWLERIHPNDRKRIKQGIVRVLRAPETFNWSEHYLVQRSDGSFAPVFDRAHIVRNEEGEALRMIGAVQDLTAVSRIAEELEINRERLSLVVSSTQLGLWYCNLPFDRLEWSETVKRHFWLPPDAEVTIDLFYERIHPEDRERTRQAIAQSIAERGRYDIEYRTVDPGSGQVRWVSAIGNAYYDPSTGQPIRFDGVTTDVTASKAEAERLRFEKEISETLYEVSKIVSAELDLKKLVQAATDAAVKLTGAQFGAFFYNVVREDGEAYTLYTLSGVDREAFAKFPMPRNTKIFAPTFEGQGIVRLDDVTQDPRYGKNAPYYGMPAGHLPVRSYLAVPVISRVGEVLGGLFMGHADAARFDERCEQLASGIASQAAVAIDNARLFKQVQDELQRRRQADEEVRRLNAELEERVLRRTAELAAANKELEAFSYSVSHDLRAPLRGISGFANLLAKRYAPVLNEEAMGFVRRVMDATQRMSDLIDDMLKLSRLTRQEMRYESLDLSGMAASVMEALQARSPERPLTVLIAPGVKGHGDPNLLRSVLENLLGNAWKFTAPIEDKACVEFGQQDKGGEQVYYVKDNGAGFNMEYAGKLFGAFQRLHSPDEFEGTGIGLATVQRVIHRHGGRVWAEGAVGEGAVFYFTLGQPPSRERTLHE